MSFSLPEIDTASSPYRVAKYTIASSLSGAFLTAAYESTRGRSRALAAQENAHAQTATGLGGLGRQHSNHYRHPTALLAGSAALNSGLVAFCFFSMREYVVSPAFMLFRQRRTHRDGIGAVNGSSPGHRDGERLTWTSLHMQNVPDTATTAGLLGSVFNAWKRGPAGIPAGGITAALACTLLQLAVNEAGIMRVRYVSSRVLSPATPDPVLPGPKGLPLIEPPPGAASDRGQDTADVTPAPTPTPTSTTASPELDDVPSFSARVLGILGFTQVSDAEYLVRLRARRERYLARIREIEEQQERERGGDEH